MKRKDGKKKLRSPRSMPAFERGFRESPTSALHSSSAETTKVVSLFSGCGGLDLGIQGGFSIFGKKYERLPFKVIAAYDNLSDAVDTYRLNLGDEIHSTDLSNVNVGDIPAADVLLGGFPCQDFSSSGPKTGISGSRGQLYSVLTEYMRVHRPKVVVGENVPHLARLSGGAYLNHILQDFESVGYNFRVWEIYGPEFGLPQSRRRLFLVGTRDDLQGSPVPPSPELRQGEYFTVDQALSDLEVVSDESVVNQSQYFVATKATAGGGQGDHANQRGAVAYCIRANARGRIQFHYSLERRLTVRECARLQSFPDEFVFPYSTQRNMTLIGNAVPPILGHLVGRSIADYLQGKSSMPVPMHKLVRAPMQLELLS